MVATALFISFSLSCVLAHMGIMQPSNARDKVLGDAYRYPNMGNCHGVAPGEVTGTWNVGEVKEFKMSDGAPHDGGHCAIFVTEFADGKTGHWYKLHEVTDCTLTGNMPFTIPAELPLACGEGGCTFIWAWTPRVSATCEIYTNCFDVKVGGSITNIDFSGFDVVAIGALDLATDCVRVDDNTHLTPHFGDLLTDPQPTALPSPTPKPVVEPTCECTCTAPEPTSVPAPSAGPVPTAPTTAAPAPTEASGDCPNGYVATETYGGENGSMQGWCEANCPGETCEVTHCVCKA